MTLARTRLTIVSIVYWLLLSYIVAALVWWFISLEQQNQQMTALRLQQLSASTWEDKQQKEAYILDLKRRKTAQYIGEGGIFMLLIGVGAVYIFQATRRQLRLGQQQQSFMMAVTHELKTPIAITTLNLQTLQKRKLDEVQRERLVNKSLEETERLNDLCNNILSTAQLESGNQQKSKEEINLTDLAASVFNRFQFRSAETRFTGSRTTSISGDAFLLELLISNLLENAVKYSKGQGLVELRVFQEGNRVMLQVKDEGPGIPGNERKKVFQKFYRVGDERTRTSKGTGLGLYLCKKIMQYHKGEILLTGNRPQGSIFTATFKI